MTTQELKDWVNVRIGKFFSYIDIRASFAKVIDELTASVSAAIPSSAIKQTTGTSETDVMSQKAVTAQVEALNDGKVNTTDIEQVRSQATNKVPASKLFDDELTALENVQLPLKANHGYESNPKTLKEVDDSVVQLAGDVNKKIYDITGGTDILSMVSIIGYYNKLTGAIGADSGFMRSGLIPINGKQIYIQIHLTDVYAAGIALFDSLKNYIGYYNANQIVDNGASAIQFAPNVAYIGVSHRIEGSTVDPFVKTLNTGNVNGVVTVNEEITLNFSVLGKYINKHGVETSLQGASCTDYIDISNYEYVAVDAVDIGTNDASTVFYDENMVAVERINILSPQRVIYRPELMGIKYIRLSLFRSTPKMFSATYERSVEKIKEVDIYSLTDYLPQTLIQKDIDWNDGFYINSSGGLNADAYHSYSSQIDISAYDYLIVVTDRNNLIGLTCNMVTDVFNRKIRINLNKGLNLYKRNINDKYIQLSKSISDRTSAIYAVTTISDINFNSQSLKKISLLNPITKTTTWIHGYYYIESGRKVRSEGFSISTPIDITGYTYISLISSRPSSSVSKNLFLDANGDAIEDVKNLEIGKERILKIPTGASSIVLSHYSREAVKPIVKLANNLTVSNNIITHDDIAKMAEDFKFGEHPHFEYGYNNPPYIEEELFGVIKPQAVVTRALFLEDTHNIPQTGVAFIFSDGYLQLVANGIRYLVNLTKIV